MHVRFCRGRMALLGLLVLLVQWVYLDNLAHMDPRERRGLLELK